MHLKTILLHIALILTFCSTLEATHIVGGDISYECLGVQPSGDIRYRVTMHVYRDAINGQAPFDNPAYIGIYSGSNAATPFVQISLNFTQTIVPINITNPCLVLPPNVAVEEALYQQEVDLPFDPDGYFLVYQRCCRNNTINNLVNPQLTGATYMIYLSPRSQQFCNNSPVFNDFPPVVICQNRQLEFDHSATDQDGDSLVYEFCNSLTGGAQSNPRPLPPLGPPYTPVTFLAGFSASYPMPSNPALNLDAVSGMLTGTPTQTGQYVVGVCVKEYRNGVLLSETLRDFQFNVAFCEDLVDAQIRADSTDPTGLAYFINSCRDSTIDLINISTIDSMITAYEWRFDLNNGQVFNSSNKNEVITFPGPGTYTGWLVANPGTTGCTDTALATVNIFPHLEAGFEVIMDTCNPNVPIQFIDTSILYGDNTIAQWQWDFGDQQFSAAQNPTYSYNQPGTYTVNLTIIDNNGCVSIAAPQVVEWYPAPNLDVQHVEQLCMPQDTVQFFNNSSPLTPDYTYFWTFGDSQVSTDSSPTHIYPSFGYYPVSLLMTSPIGCETSYNGEVHIHELPTIDFDYTYDPCVYDSIAFEDLSVTNTNGDALISWQWTFGDGESSNLQNPKHLYDLAGTYSVTLVVTDINGCAQTLIKTIDFYPAPAVDVQVNITQGCAPFLVSFDNQSRPINGYTLLWTFGDGDTDTTVSPQHLYENPGTYEVTLLMTSPIGCQTDYKDTLTVYGPPSAEFSYSYDRCSLDSMQFWDQSQTNLNGDAITAWSWTLGDGHSTSVQNPKHRYQNAGTYPVILTITDINGCSAMDTLEVTQYELLGLTLAEDSVTCKYGSDGQIQAFVTGGGQPYSYNWSNPALDTAINSNIPAGNYSLVVTDINGCTISAGTFVGEPLTAVVANINNSVNISCNGDSDGEIHVDAFGGTPNYTFLWSTGETTEALTGLLAGTYSVTATDARGCPAMASGALTQPPAIVVDAHVYSNYNGANISCIGAADGSASVLASGGSGSGYTYEWNTGENNPIIHNLDTGTYTVTVTDFSGCMAEDTVILLNPRPLEATISQTDISCYGELDGQITVNAVLGTGTVGVGGYEYKITGPNQLGNVFSQVNSWSGLAAGDYTVTVRDGNDCELELIVSIVEPSLLEINPFAYDVNCNGGTDGLVGASISGGTVPYDYQWSMGSSLSIVGGLGAGTYTLTITDANGCIATAATTINEPDLLTATINTVAASCHGVNNGQAVVSANGGTTPYRYLWSNGQTGQSAAGFGAGNYSMTVTDANNCTTIANYTITEPTVLALASDSTSVSCHNGTDGTVTVLPSGGTAPYTYLWNDINGQTTATATGLSAGLYTVVVSDAGDCTQHIHVEVVEPNPLFVQIQNTVPASCNGSADGQATALAIGGTPNYAYRWSTGALGSTATGLSAGTSHSVTVEDAEGCIAQTTVVVTEPTALTIAPVVVTDVTCYGGNNGTAAALVSGGTPVYTVNWSNSTSGYLATDLSAGLHSITVTDASNCTATQFFTVGQPASPLLATIQTTNALCSGAATGAAAAVVSGGTTAYVYTWNTGAQTRVIDSIPTGNYTITVTDANGCTTSADGLVGDGNTLAVDIINHTDADCFGGSNGTAEALAVGGTGTLDYIWSDALGQEGTVVTGLAAGLYFVQVVDENKCTAIDSITIEEGEQITIISEVKNISCYGKEDGQVLIQNSNANLLNYEWSTSAVNTNPLTNLAKGTYGLTVTTDQGCQQAFEFEIEEPDSLVVALELLNGLACNGDQNAVLNANPKGGTPNYNYQWSTIATAPNNRVLSSLTAGNYRLTVSDQNTCSAEASYTIVEPNPLTLATTTVGVICAGDANGQILVEGSGGSLLAGNYAYSVDSLIWQTGNIFADLTAGIYTVYLKDDNGCVLSQSTTVESADPFYITSLTADTTIEYLDTLWLNAELNELDRVSYQWQDDFGTVLTDSSLMYSLTPTEQAVYYFSATNEYGCRVDSLVHVRVEKPRRVNAPLAFTPNGDGTNDRFFLQGGEKVSNIQVFRVYDRWGTLVYEGTDLQVNDANSGWDGNYKGKPMNSGVFAWYAVVVFGDGYEEVYKGDVTLLR